VHITDMTASPPIVAAVASGAADIGYSVVTSTAVAHERGIPVRFIAPGALWVTANGTAQLVVAKDSPLQSAASFNGKTIAVTGIADLTYYGTKAWLDRNGADTATIKWVELSFPEMAAAVAQHRVDGAMIAEPFLEAAKPTVKFVAAVDDAVAPRFMSTGWIATNDWIKAHPAEAAKFAEVMRQTSQWANTHQKESAQILLKHTRITPETAATMSRVEYATSLDAKLLQPSIDADARNARGRTDLETIRSSRQTCSFLKSRVMIGALAGMGSRGSAVNHRAARAVPDRCGAVCRRLAARSHRRR
jgi:NitT/TauT family transport system substrate-binding protein